MKKYKTFFKQKWVCFALSIVFYFVPVIVVTACLLPLTEASTGTKWAIGMGVLVIHAIPFFAGVIFSFLSHYPMFNIFPFLFLALQGFFTLDYFQYYAQIFKWIELAAAISSIASCICWGLFRKYSVWRESIKANVRSGAFNLKEEDK